MTSANMGRQVLDQELIQRTGELIAAGTYIAERGWVPATSGNFSARLSSGRIAITVSGRHKGRLSERDIMVVDHEGRSTGGGQRSSAETLLHTAIYQRYPEAGAVLHTHSMAATLLSRRDGELLLEGYELLKAFNGVQSHDSRVVVPVFPNEQDIQRLSAQVNCYLDGASDLVYGYLISGHGLYTWGATIEETLRHLEAFEFIFQCELNIRGAA